MKKPTKRELRAYKPTGVQVLFSQPGGVEKFERMCGFHGPLEASKALGIPLRTYCRYKADGLPSKLQREVILDRMEAVLAKKARA
jgi:hypothetical protein